MRVIKYDLNTLKNAFNSLDGNDENSFETWLETADKHLQRVKELDPSERGKYWSKNNIWSDLYPALSKLSKHKCWYSEAPENSSEWEIEHFRPKGQALGLEREVLRSDGYWWLSYKWHNFRLAGSLVNKLRKDRFTDEEHVFGKGNFFPLCNDDIGQPEDEYCECERPLLLDPLKPRDVTLISFDQNGEPFPTYSEEQSSLYFSRALNSIKYYGLDHKPICRGREKIWKKCELTISRAHNYIVNNINDPVRRDDRIDQCYWQLMEFSQQSEPYSMVVRNFVKEKIKDEKYSWLKDVQQVLQ